MPCLQTIVFPLRNVGKIILYFVVSYCFLLCHCKYLIVILSFGSQIIKVQSAIATLSVVCYCVFHVALVCFLHVACCVLCVVYCIFCVECCVLYDVCCELCVVFVCLCVVYCRWVLSSDTNHQMQAMLDVGLFLHVAQPTNKTSEPKG